jgi:hypothetical protein
MGFGQKDSREFAVTSHNGGATISTLTGFEATVSLIDDVNPAFTADHAIIAVP